MSESSGNESFERLLRDLFGRAKLKDGVINKILNNEKYMGMFSQAFVHKSYDINSRKNYEKVEQLGDLVLNMAIVNYVVAKFPIIQSAHWLTNIKHTLISGKSFATLASQLNFYPHIKMSDEMRESIQTQISKAQSRGVNYIDSVDEYRGILEDVFEAFNGTLQLVVDDISGLKAGPGYAVCYELVSSFLDNIKIPTSVEDIFPPVTMVKEIYDAHKWPNKTNDMIITRLLDSEETQVTYVAPIEKGDGHDLPYLKDPETSEKKYLYKLDGNVEVDVNNVFVYEKRIVDLINYAEYIEYPVKEGYPVEDDVDYGPPSVVKVKDILYLFKKDYRKKRTLLGTGIHLNKAEAQKLAAIQTLEILKTRYGITPKIKNAKGT